MNGIIWLASYPKSGNTWFRAFISALIEEKDEGISINNMKTDGIFSSRSLLDAVTGIESSNLTMEEIDWLRPKVYNYLATISKSPLFIKVHDAYTYLESGTPLLGTVNAKAIYIIRNPLDVAVSFSNHMSVDLDAAIRTLGENDFAFCQRITKLPEQFRQKLLSWSAHVESWACATELPVHFLRYEDMKADPVWAFTDAVHFIGLQCTKEQIQKAINLSSFDKMKAAEKREGFKERPVKTTSFFRAGMVGDWRNHLSEKQRDQVIANHKDTMIKYGYLDKNGVPVI